MKETICPCGSGKEYAVCCGCIISGKEKACSPETLMRARYSAYVMHEIDFIIKSCVPVEGEGEIDLEETRKWSEESEWHGLKIIRTEKGSLDDTEGTVEFTATYTRKGLRDVHHEISRFVKKDGNWLYESGSLVPEMIVRDGAKIGRNDLCPCGSGKKYKKCCGR